MQSAIAPGPREKCDSRFSRVPAHQHETLDEITYRTSGTTADIAKIMDMNPHALSSPRMKEGTVVNIPSQIQTSPRTIQLWD